MAILEVPENLAVEREYWFTLLLVFNKKSVSFCSLVHTLKAFSIGG